MKTRLLAAQLLLTLASTMAAASPPHFELGDDVSSYHRFLIYPHLSKGFAAMEKGHGEAAIAEFRRARELAPRNVLTALYLADAYRRFGQPDEAEAVVSGQRRYTPNDPRLRAAQPSVAAGTGAGATPVDCARARTAACRTQAGQDALRGGHLAVVEAQLDDQAFAASADGIALRRALAQRAIYLRDWKRADAQLARLDANQLMIPTEREQWFNVQLLQGKLREARSIQDAGALNAPGQQLALANALARDGDMSALADYLVDRRPVFANSGDEKQWLSLLARADHADADVLAGYRPQFAASRRVHAELALPRLLARGDAASARRLLEQFPPDAFRQTRFDLAIAERRLDEAQRQATELARSGSIGLLDSLSYRLIQAGGDAQAARLLMDAYPFADGADLLLQRLAALVTKQPDVIGPMDLMRLQQPLASTSLRESQAIMLGALKDCDGVSRVLGDLDPGYGADRWAQLGDCIQHSKPGLAEHAYTEAGRRRQSDATTRSIAYQAFATKNYRGALSAWRAVPTQSLTADDAIAAARTSLAAEDNSTKEWLDLYVSSGGVQDDGYWWLRAQANLATDPGAAQADIERAIAGRADARYFSLLAKLQMDAGRQAEAISSLKQAVALGAEDAEANAALGYAYWNAGEAEKAREQFEIAHAAYPDDATFVQQLVYANQSVGDNEEARRYARLAIDAMERDRDEENANSIDTQRFALRRLHEDLGRRWRLSADMLLGTHATSVANSIDPAVSYRSYSQIQADYRLGGAVAARDPEALVAYGRVFAGSGESGDVLPFHSPTLGIGLRWKPFPSQVLYLALEQQLPLNDRSGRHSDTMVRASASFLGDGRYNDDWHPSGSGWMTQNLYLDAAHYLKSEQSVMTAIYRVGLHRKIAPGQTIEPYARLQYSGVHHRGGDGTDRDVRTGLGVRWNYWYGQTQYDAYRHKVGIGLEWQHAIDTYLADKNAVFLILGGSW